jgi:hypothetical protein
MPSMEFFNDENESTSISSHETAMIANGACALNQDISPSRVEKKNITLNSARKIAGQFINYIPVQNFILLLIMINGIIMGIATFDFISKDDDKKKLLESIDLGFLIIFTIESGLQIFHEGKKIIHDGWTLFDVIVILTCWLGNKLSVLRTLRSFRSVRVFRRIPDLRILIESFLTAIPSMATLVIILTFSTYALSVVCTEMFRNEMNDIESQYPYYASLSASFLTSIQMMTFDNWSKIVREGMVFNHLCWIPMVSYVISCGIIFLNLNVAVLCQAVTATARNEEKKSHFELIAEEKGDPYSRLEKEVHELENLLNKKMILVTYMNKQMKQIKKSNREN